MRLLRQIDQRSSRDTHLRGKPRTLGADRILDHLHHQRLAFEHDLLDGRMRRIRMRFASNTRMPDIRYVQERCALEPDIDKRRLHARQHAHDLAEIHISYPSARQRALDVKLLHRALLNEGNAGFLRCDVDQDFFVHGRFRSRRAPRAGVLLFRKEAGP